MKVIKAQTCSSNVIVSVVKSIVGNNISEVYTDSRDLCDIISSSGFECEYLEDISFLMTGMYDNGCIIISELSNAESPILPIVCEDIIELVV